MSPEQTVAEDPVTMDPSKAADLLGGLDVEAVEPQPEEEDASADDVALESSAAEPARESDEHSNEPSLPVVDCAFCSATLTNEDQWAECAECGVYSHAACQEGQPVCARCGARM